MREGFTLIELLAVIVILAIVALIATPLVIDIIENTKIKSFVMSEKSIIKATENYLAMNPSSLPYEIGETKQVTLDELRSNHYIGVVKDYNNNTCNGYILITKTAVDAYDYVPFLKCGETSDINNYVDDGLVAYWKLDGDAYDYTPNNNHGELINTEPWVNRFNEPKKALKFNGTNSSVKLPALNYPQMSVTLWFNHLEQDTSNTDAMFGGWHWSTQLENNEGFDLRFYQAYPTRLNFNLISIDLQGTKIKRECQYDLAEKSTNHWIFVTITYDQTSGYQKLYVNDKLACSVFHKENNTIVPLVSYPDMRIGYSRVNTGYFNGYIDDVAMYNRPLTPEEVKFIYNFEKSRAR